MGDWLSHHSQIRFMTTRHRGRYMALHLYLPAWPPETSRRAFLIQMRPLVTIPAIRSHRDPEWMKVFRSDHGAQKWFEKSDPEGVDWDTES